MTYQKDIIRWQGYTIEVSFWEKKHKLYGYEDAYMSHLEIRCLEPVKAPLPMTESGYRSHHAPPEHILEYGSAKDYVLAWLEHEAKTDTWKQREAAAKQFSLF